jgi:hypothetical protein
MLSERKVRELLKKELPKLSIRNIEKLQ